MNIVSKRAQEMMFVTLALGAGAFLIDAPAASAENELSSVLASLWDCTQSDDEFERIRCVSRAEVAAIESSPLSDEIRDELERAAIGLVADERVDHLHSAIAAAGLLRALAPLSQTALEKLMSIGANPETNNALIQPVFEAIFASMDKNDSDIGVVFDLISSADADRAVQLLRAARFTTRSPNLEIRQTREVIYHRALQRSEPEVRIEAMYGISNLVKGANVSDKIQALAVKVVSDDSRMPSERTEAAAILKQIIGANPRQSRDMVAVLQRVARDRSVPSEIRVAAIHSIAYGLGYSNVAMEFVDEFSNDPDPFVVQQVERDKTNQAKDKELIEKALQ